MKKIFTIAMIFISYGVLGSDISDFEKGYVAGTNTCEVANEAWVCTVSWDNNVYFSKRINRESLGRSRADALLKFRPEDILKGKNDNLNGSIVCKEI